MIVERDYGQVQTELAHTLSWVGGALVVALVLVGTMVGLARRSLRSHEAVHDAPASAWRQASATCACWCRACTS